jgi:pyruvate formate lyase activating enzyme
MDDLKSTPGVIFNIQHYSIHDGPGIRSTVFVNGCPLQCAWCQNPESRLCRPQLFFNVELCAGCGKCVPVCPQDAIEIVESRSRTNRELCNASGRCVEVCPNEARTMMGRHVTAGEVFEEAASDRIFFESSGGGVTVSGGEPMVQHQFTSSLLRLCKGAGLHTAVDTCGYADWAIAREVLAHADLVLLDLKHMDSGEHKRLTGVPNELILENARRIAHELAIPMRVRVPIIPGSNDSVANLEATARFIATELNLSTAVDLIPYHRMGTAKLEQLEMKNGFTGTPPSEAEMAELKRIVESAGLTVQVGG